MAQPLELEEERADDTSQQSAEAAITLRPAAMEDMEFILRCGKEFHSEAIGDAVPFDYKSLALTVAEMLRAARACILIAERAGVPCATAGAHFYPLFFNHAHLTGQEQWFWTCPAARRSGVGRALLVGLEAEARGRGGASLAMIALAPSSGTRGPADGTAARLYREAGYKKLQTVFFKQWP